MLITRYFTILIMIIIPIYKDDPIIKSKKYLELLGVSWQNLLIYFGITSQYTKWVGTICIPVFAYRVCILHTTYSGMQYANTICNSIFSRARIPKGSVGGS